MSKPSKQIFEVGTLKYTFSKLISVSFWLLCGIFWYDMVQYVMVPTLMPVNFKALGASGAWIGICLGSIPSMINFFLNPIISTASDRARTRWGRRIPFMAVAIPPVTLFCLILGWLPEFRGQMAAWFPNYNANYILLVAYSIFFILFYVSGLLIGIVSSYITPDVIPFKFIGRFQIAKGFMGNGASFVFNFFLMRYSEHYGRWLYTGIAILFALSFTCLCLFIKEGEYPPPETVPEKGPLFTRIKDHLVLYFKDCFSKPFYLLVFLGFALTNVSMICRTHFNILFATETLQLTRGQYGQIMGYGNIMSLTVLFGLAFIIDKCNALVLYMTTGIAVIFLNIWGYFFVSGYYSFLVVGLTMTFVYTMQSLSSTPMLILLFPKEKFGQFCSAAMMVLCFFSITCNWACGRLVDIFGYRFIYVWDFVLTSLATVVLLVLYLEYRKPTCPAKISSASTGNI